MKLKLCACLVLGALVCASQAAAAPILPVFLSVDINGGQGAGSQGPTRPGWQGWTALEGLFLDPSEDWANSGAAGLTKVFTSTQGNITANIIGFAPSATRGSRNRGANSGALTEVTQDFVFAQRGLGGFGQNYIKLVLSGLTPNRLYEFTGWARDHFNGGTGANNPSVSFQAWTDRAALGGIDGPGPWMDANFDPDPALYQPIGH
jgi:hypothetical protein